MSAFLALMLTLAAAAGVENAAAVPGDWPESRQNPHLTAFQPLTGHMREAPALLGAIDLGRTRPSLTEAATAEGETVGLCVVAGELRCYNVYGELVWSCHPPGLNFERIVACEDLNLDGKPEVALQAGRPDPPYGAAVLVSLEKGEVTWQYDVEPMSYSWHLYVDHYLPQGALRAACKQLVVLMQGYPPDKQNGYVALFEFRAGADGVDVPMQRWRYDFDAYTCFPSLLRTDLDSDGALELVVETHSRMWFLDVLTGAVKHFAQWDVSPANVRSYGLVRFVDLDGDGGEDFLCIADFAQHHEVLLNQDGAMVKAWSYGWPESVTTGKVATCWPEPPYADVDGDGGLDVVVSMYNSEDKAEWLVRVYDAVTGEFKYTMPGMVAVRLADMNDEGAAEILCGLCTDPTRAAMRGAAVLGVQNGALAELWRDGDVVAQARDDEDGLYVAHRGKYYRIVVGEASQILLEDAAFPSPEPGTDWSAVPAVVGAPFPTLLAADLTGDGRNDLVTYGEGVVRVYDVVPEKTVLSPGKVFEARAPCAPAISDFDGDGRLECATVELSADGHAAVRWMTLREDAEDVRSAELQKPERAGLPQPRKAYLRMGRFTGAEHPDLYVWIGTPVVRSLVMDGRSGEVLWEKGEAPGLPRYWGPSVNFASATDWDGDGAEDLVFTNPDYYCVASGRTGELLQGPSFPPEVFSQPSQGLYTYPALLERAEGPPLVCLVGGHYFQAAMSLRAEPLWYALPGIGESRTGFEGFMRAPAGDWLMGFGRKNGRFACVNVSDGSVRWELPVEATCSDIVSGDVDGDGRPEFVFGTSHGALYAVGDGGDAGPRVVWNVNLGAGLGTPILADLTGDGGAEIALPMASGHVVILGAAGQANGR